MDKKNKEIKVAIVGVGNCCSALVQGIHYYNGRNQENTNTLISYDINGYLINDIKIVAAFDIDDRKVGKDLSEAIFSPPNCTKKFYEEIPNSGVSVYMGNQLDGISDHMLQQEESVTFKPSKFKPKTEDEIVSHLLKKKVEVLVNFLPVGSIKATEFYANCALQAGTAFINCIPVFIASNVKWAKRFEDKNLPLIGDDIKSQLGATIIHRNLIELINYRGVQLDSTYQLNFGGNTDFLNMKNEERLTYKRISKTESVKASYTKKIQNIHIAPSDYVASQLDNKIAHINVKGKIFGDIPIEVEIKLSVEDSPNSAGVVVDCIRIAKCAIDDGIGGVLKNASAFHCKHPPVQLSDLDAYYKMCDLNFW